MSYTIKITNKKNDITSASLNLLNLETVSPTLINELKTTYEEYVADMSLQDDSIYVPLYKKLQVVRIPANSLLTITTEDADEAIYYSRLKVNNALTIVDPDPITGGRTYPVLIEKTITENGLYLASQDEADGYSTVDVSVENSYSVEDEGKVVSDGSLVAQTAMAEEITENNTYDTTLYNSITVNVSGGSSAISGYDVRFLDNEHNVVAAYSKEEFMSLTEMPENPVRDGLTAQGWNWTLADAKNYIGFTSDTLDIGQMYVTSDGKTRITHRVTEYYNLEFYLGFLKLADNTELDIDWGDNTAHSTLVSGVSEISHTYQRPGDYIMVITVNSGSFSIGNADVAFLPLKIELGTNVTSINCCYIFISLQSVTLPYGITEIEDEAFASTNLKTITIPNSVTSIGEYAFEGCKALSSINIPRSVTSIGDSAFAGCTALSKITFPSNVTNIGSDVLVNNHNTLYSVTFESDTPPTLSGDMWDYSDNDVFKLCKIRIPSSGEDEYTSERHFPTSSDGFIVEYY